MRSIDRQRGDALFEALVGVVVAGIVGLGLAYTASRILVSQTLATGQFAVLEQMTNSLNSQGVATLCGGTAPANISVAGHLNQMTATTVTDSIPMSAPACTNGTVTVSGPANAQAETLTAGVVTTMTLSTPAANSTAQALLGGSGVMTISQ